MDPIGKFNNIFDFSWMISVLIDKMFSLLVILYQQNNNKCEHELSDRTFIRYTHSQKIGKPSDLKVYEQVNQRA
jgi:hypothetical protein